MNAMNEMGQRLHDGQERLARDLRSVVDDAEELLRHAVRDASDGYGEARSRLEHSVKAAKSELATLEKAMRERVHDAGRAADQYVHRHPWESIGVGAGVGLLVGLLIGRR